MGKHNWCAIGVAVGIAVSGAFFGGLVAALYLIIKIRKNRKEFLKDMKIIEKYIKQVEAADKKACEIANKMIMDGKLTIDQIAEYSGLSTEKVREIAGNKSA